MIQERSLSGSHGGWKVILDVLVEHQRVSDGMGAGDQEIDRDG
jgi:hypothetical protein